MPSFRDVQFRHARRFACVIHDLQSLYQTGGQSIELSLSEYSAVRPQLEAGQFWAAKNATIDDGAAELCIEYSSALVPGDASVALLGVRVTPSQRMTWLRAGESAAARLGDWWAATWHLYQIGVVHIELSEYEDGVECLERAMAVFRNRGERHAEGCVLSALGSAHRSFGNPATALECYEAALALFRESESTDDETSMLSLLGSLYANLQLFDRAEESYAAALAPSRHAGRSGTEVSVHIARARNFIAMGKMAQAREALERAADILRKIDQCRHGTLYTNDYVSLGSAYLMLDPQAGLSYLELELERFRAIENRMGEAYTLLLIGLGNAIQEAYSEAVRLSNEALAAFRSIEDSLGQGLSLIQIGNANQSQGNLQGSIQAYSCGLEVFRSARNERYMGDCLWRRSSVLAKRGELAQAVADATAALELFDSIAHPKAAIVRKQLDRWAMGVESDDNR